jgi:hypothetical protein
LLGLMRMESKNFDESIGMTCLTTQSLRLQVLTLQIALVRHARAWFGSESSLDEHAATMKRTSEPPH